MLQQRGEGMRQHFVGAIADEHLFRSHLVVGGEGGAQRGGLRVRIKTQAVGRLAADRIQRARGRRPNGFSLGVELDQLRHARLFARHIGTQNRASSGLQKRLIFFLSRYRSTSGVAVPCRAFNRARADMHQSGVKGRPCSGLGTPDQGPAKASKSGSRAPVNRRILLRFSA